MSFGIMCNRTFEICPLNQLNPNNAQTKLNFVLTLYPLELCMRWMVGQTLSGEIRRFCKGFFNITTTFLITMWENFQLVFQIAKPPCVGQLAL
jgi:hypothetical protein